jgi:phage host-nuclease inhibitor protein Gam
MKTKTPKLKLPILNDRTDADLAMHELACYVNAKQKITAERDAEILKITERCAPELAAIEQGIKARTAMLEAWAIAHPEEFPKDQKSIELSAGRIGFQIPPPSVALLNRKWTWETATEAASRLLPHFMRQKLEIDKQAILQQREDLAESLPKCGLKISQGENFYADPDLTKVTARQTT